MKCAVKMTTAAAPDETLSKMVMIFMPVYDHLRSGKSYKLAARVTFLMNIAGAADIEMRAVIIEATCNTDKRNILHSCGNINNLFEFNNSIPTV